MIQFEHVYKQYEMFQALNDVSFHIERGEFAYITGDSGAGKSTIIKLLLKEIEPTSGSIQINNVDITHMYASEIPYYRRNLGIVFQDYKLFPKKTVYNNIAFALRVIDTKEEEIPFIINKVLADVGLKGKEQQFPHELSGGEQQRVAIARAIVNNPKILIADEPTGNLDQKNAWDIIHLFESIQEKYGTTILMATHDMDIVRKNPKHLLRLDRGLLVEDKK